MPRKSRRVLLKMNDVKFDLNSVYFLEKPARELESGISDYAYEFDKLYSRNEEERSGFTEHLASSKKQVGDMIARLRRNLFEIEERKREANEKKQNEIPPVTPPTVPQGSADEQRKSINEAYESRVREVDEANARIREQNEKIDAYTAACDEAASKTEEIITKLKDIDEEIGKVGEDVISTMAELSASAYNQKSKNRSTASASAIFTYAISQTYEAALAIESMHAHSPRGVSDIAGQFVIKNTHTHERAFSRSHSTQDIGRIEITTDTKNDIMPDESSSEKITVSERNADDFFRRIEGKRIIEMPSANIRFLGGRAFKTKMEALGYKLTENGDGAVIDKNRMIRWEKI